MSILQLPCQPGGIKAESQNNLEPFDIIDIFWVRDRRVQMNRCQPYVDKLPIELTVLLGLFGNTCNFNDLPSVN